MLSSIRILFYSSSSDEESCSRQDIFGLVRNSNSCHMTVIDVGWYSQKVWNLSSCKAGQSSMIWALSSLTAAHKRHFGSISGFTFDRWYFRKLWPVRCLIHRPKSCRPNARSSFESLKFGSEKNIFVCLHVVDSVHLFVHFSSVDFRPSDYHTSW